MKIKYFFRKTVLFQKYDIFIIVRHGNNILKHRQKMETVILLYGLAALLGYIWIEFAEIRNILRNTENNIITAIYKYQLKDEIPNESTTNNK
jgi:hypothetical protein